MLLRLNADRSATTALLKTSRSGMAKYHFDPAANRTVRKHMSMDLRHHVVLRGRRSLYPDVIEYLHMILSQRKRLEKESRE